MRIFQYFFIFFTLVFTTYCQSSFAKPYYYLYAFGDSLTDNGNLYAMTYYRKPTPLPNPKEYFYGRFSNGLVWIEYLAPMLNLPSNHVMNMAYGGADTGKNNYNDVKGGAQYPGLAKEVTLFLQQYRAKKIDNQHALYIIWSGADNFLGKFTDPEKTAEDAARGVSDAIIRLHIQAGAQHFMLINIPFLGFTPYVLSLEKNRPGTAKKFNDIVGFTNQFYQQQAQRLNKKWGIDITYVNTNRIFLDMIHQPQKYGFTNVNQSCYALQQQNGCQNPSEFLFWGVVHPSTKTHRIIARWLYDHYLK